MMRPSEELTQTYAVDESGEIIDMGMLPGREVACDTVTCEDRNIWKLVPNDNSPVSCGACQQPIIDIGPADVVEI